jgi:hypothetical protein
VSPAYPNDGGLPAVVAAAWLPRWLPEQDR